jgi:hypothetical protein
MVEIPRAASAEARCGPTPLRNFASVARVKFIRLPYISFVPEGVTISVLHPPPPGFLVNEQTKGVTESVFVSADSKGVEVVQNEQLREFLYLRILLGLREGFRSGEKRLGGLVPRCSYFANYLLKPCLHFTRCVKAGFPI